ncbi:hypothetical protein FS749_010506 [Ceratobasidium sp. UAMH 11750]|nr:hypothetical protein FS749_010506 [Ceratobasidium sp. UAMH 11750]
MAATSLDNSPTDLLLYIFAHSTITSVRQCRKVCRSLRKFIDTNDYLQYKLELDACGYVEPLHPRTDLSYAAKTEMLRKRNAWWSNPTSVTPVRYELPGYDTKGRGIFKNGTFMWNQDVDGGGERLVFYQLPSANKGTEFKQWSIDLENKYFGLWIDPEQDLLVVVEAGSGLPDNVPDDIHLRSMSTNQPHPKAIPGRTVLRYTPPSHSSSLRGRIIKIFQHLLIGLYFNPWDDKADIVIWNWTTGQELSHLTIPDFGINRSVELLNESSFAVCRSSAPPEMDPIFQTNTPGWLSVYQFDPQTTTSKQATHIISFALPADQLEDCRLRELRLDPVPTSAQNHHGSPAKVYNSAPGDRLMHIIHYYPSTGSRPGGTFYIPCSVLLSELAKYAPQPTPKLVLWSEWADRVVQSTHQESPRYSYTHAFGHRVVSLSFDLRSLDITVFDLHPRRLTSGGTGRPHSKSTILVDHTTQADTERWMEEGYQVPKGVEQSYAWIDEEHLVIRRKMAIPKQEYSLLVYNF